MLVWFELDEASTITMGRGYSVYKMYNGYMMFYFLNVIRPVRLALRMWDE